MARVLLSLSDYSATREGLLQFLNDIRDQLPAPLQGPAFSIAGAQNPLLLSRPIPAFWFALVLQRWEKDETAKKLHARLPWRTQVVDVGGPKNPVPILGVYRKLLRDQWRRDWDMLCEEFVAERQILPEQQKRLRRNFQLLSINRCNDASFFQDKFHVLLPSSNGTA